MSRDISSITRHPHILLIVAKRAVNQASSLLLYYILWGIDKLGMMSAVSDDV